MRMRVALLALLAAVMAASACAQDRPTAAGGSGAANAPGAAGPPAASATAGAAVNDQVPETLRFTSRTLDGAAFDAATLAGRPAVLWFWAPWCATCAGQAPLVAELAAEHAGKVRFVGVAGLGDLKAMKEFVSDTEVGTVPHLADERGEVWKRFAITEQSVYLLLDNRGKVVHQGYLDTEQITRRVAELAG